MLIGIPKEIKKDENRVALPPNGVRELLRYGHSVYVEAGAGSGSGFTDEEYQQSGATILHSAEEVWTRAQMIVKVKEPQASEFPYLRPDLILFTYLHLAADQALTQALLSSGVVGVAYETVVDAHGKLPLLEPMSEVAGRMAAQVAAHYLEKRQGGRGVLMGGVPGVMPAQAVVLGGGTVGTQAAKIMLGMGANVTILDVNLERLRALEDILAGRLTTLYSNAGNVARVIQSADVVIGSVLIVGARAPKLITRDMLSSMPSASVIVDVAVDQGGCVETTRPTTHSDPTYVVDGVLHYGVANMPGAVPRTSSLALSNATLRYILKIANLGLVEALLSDEGFTLGLNTAHGELTCQGVSEAFGMGFVPPRLVLEQKLR